MMTNYSKAAKLRSCYLVQLTQVDLNAISGNSHCATRSGFGLQLICYLDPVD